MRRSDGMACSGRRLAVIDAGKVAVSHYRVLERFRAHTHTRVKLETGRTHQIRRHMSHIGYPLVGDPVYGGASDPRYSQTSVQTSRICAAIPRLSNWMKWRTQKRLVTGTQDSSR